jgi:hypothetical protein
MGWKDSGEQPTTGELPDFLSREKQDGPKRMGSPAAVGPFSKAQAYRAEPWEEFRKCRRSRLETMYSKERGWPPAAFSYDKRGLA